MLMFHSCAVVIATVIQNGDKIDCDASTVSLTILRMGIHCLRDDFVELSMGVEVIGLTMSMFFSHFFLSPQHLALLTCHCVCLCVQCFRPHNENLFTSLAKQKPASDLPATINAVVNTCEVKYYKSSI